MKESRKLTVFFTIIFIIFGMLVFYIFLPFVNTILTAIIFGYLFYPVYDFLYKRTGMKRISSFIVCVLFIIILTLPSLFVINVLTQEVFGISKSLAENSLDEQIRNIECNKDNAGCFFINGILKEYLSTAINDLITYTTDRFKVGIGKTLLLIPNMILQIFILIFMMYYLFIDGDKFMDKMKSLTPIAARYKDKLFSQINIALKGILYGNIMVGIAQGGLAGIGFFIFGVHNPIILAMITFFASFIPIFGTAIIWVPVALSMMFKALSSGDGTGIMMGIGLLIYCTLFVGTIDNLLRPKLVSDQTNIHPLLILFGVLGGIGIFNLAGIVIGPLILGIFITLLELIEELKYFDPCKKC
jgi:predicted PurR-regulated permease PerM